MRASSDSVQSSVAAGDPLAGGDRLAASSSSTRARRRGCRRRPTRGARWKASNALTTSAAVDVVAHLLAAVAEDRVRLAGDGAAHQVGEEAVQLRAGVLRAGQAAAAEADGRHVEVAPVLLHHQVGGGLRDAEQRVHASRRSTSWCRCRRSSGWSSGSSSRVAALLERQEVRRVAVDLVGRGEDERRVGLHAARVASSRFSVPLALTREVGLRVATPPSRATAARRCGRPSSRSRADALEQPQDAVGVADVELGSRRNCRRAASTQPLGRARRSRRRARRSAARMSFSIPITSKPARAKCATASEPISPPDPVTIDRRHMQAILEDVRV